MDFDVGDIVIAKKNSNVRYCVTNHINRFIGKVIIKYNHDMDILVLNNKRQQAIGERYEVEKTYFINLTKILPKIMRDENAENRN